jgi:hypothetical protein
LLFISSEQYECRVYLHYLSVLNAGLLVVYVGVKPDIVTVGKPMGNGHPIAAVVTTKEIARDFLAKRPDLQNEVRPPRKKNNLTISRS